MTALSILLRSSKILAFASLMTGAIACVPQGSANGESADNQNLGNTQPDLGQARVHGFVVALKDGMTQSDATVTLLRQDPLETPTGEGVPVPSYTKVYETTTDKWGDFAFLPPQEEGTYLLSAKVVTADGTLWGETPTVTLEELTPNELWVVVK